MSLEHLRRTLAERGHLLSVATLSYWRSGRRRPERLPSLAALAELERILDVDPGALVALTPPRRSVLAQLPSVVAGLSSAQGLDRLVSRLGEAYDDGLEKVSYQDLLDIDADGKQARHRVRMLARATREGADRFPIAFHFEDAPNLPGVRAVSGCRVGSLRRTDSPNEMTLEIVLDHPLACGETTLVEFELDSRNARSGSQRWERGVLAPLSMYLISLRFDAARMPVSVERYERIIGAEQERTSPVLVTSSTVSVLFVDVAPGLAGVCWRW